MAMPDLQQYPLTLIRRKIRRTTSIFSLNKNIDILMRLNLRLRSFSRYLQMPIFYKKSDQCFCLNFVSLFFITSSRATEWLMCLFFWSWPRSSIYYLHIIFDVFKTKQWFRYIFFNIIEPCLVLKYKCKILESWGVSNWSIVYHQNFQSVEQNIIIQEIF